MAGFSLEDVRDTYASDMSSFSTLIDDASKALLSSPALTNAFPKATNGRGLFEEVAAYAHSVFGSSSLIDLTSMTSVAQALEQLALRADELVHAIGAQIEQARSVASLCQQSGDVLRQILDLELAGRQSEAAAKAAAFVPRIEGAAVLLPEAKSIEERASDEAQDFGTAAPAADSSAARQEFEFSDEQSGEEARPVSESAGEGEADELRGVFREEAQGFVSPLERHLRALQHNPTDLVAIQGAERIYHTLKGAAATIGLAEVAAVAAKLQNIFEPLAVGDAQASAAVVEEVLSLTNQLFRATGLRTLEPQPSAVAASVASDRTKAYFMDEARTIRAQGQKLFDLLERAVGAERLAAASQLERLFHGLKGSALVLGETQIASIAQKIQGQAKLLEVAGIRSSLDALTVLVGAAEADSEQRDASAVADSISRQDEPRSSEVASKSLASAPARTSETVTTADDQEIWNAFLQESEELLDGIDKEILSLERSTDPKASLQAVFRSVHTLKGAISSVGLLPTGKMLHVVEDVLEKLLDEPVLPSMKNVTTALLVVQSEIRQNLVEAPKGSVQSSHTAIAEWLDAVFSGALNRGSSTSSSAASSAESQVESEASAASKVRVRPEEELRTERRFIRVPTERLDELMNLAGELVVNRSRLLTRVDVLRALQAGLGDTRRTLFNRVDEFRQRYEFADLGGSVTQRAANDGSRFTRARVKPQLAKASGDTAFGFSEIELDRYEDVHILARSLAEVADDLTEMDSQIVRELNQITEESDSFGAVISRIQSEVTRTRMISAEALFSRLQLPIREAAHQEGKNIEISMPQNEVALDKNIIDALYKPMLHLVRNAVVHGIEPSDERVKAGKRAEGQISLRARQEAAQIVLEISDDGRGLQLAALKEKGVEAGLVSPDTPLDDPAIQNLLFAARISTASKVGTVAGRGVGGDVVKKSIERLNGDIRVETTAGQGTTFTITLPITLLITPALVFRSGGHTFAIPLFFAERIIEIEDGAMVDVLGSYQLKLGGRFIPVRRLERIWGEGTPERAGPVVLLRIGERRLALQVDSLVSREEVVVKNLGRLLGGHPLFAGVTLRGSGDLVLIVDVPGLMDHENVKERVASETVHSGVSETEHLASRTSSVAGASSSHSGASPVSPSTAMRPVMRVVTEEATRVVSEAAVELVKGPAAPDRAVGAPMSSVPSVSQVPVVSALPPSGVAAQGAIARPRVLFVDDSLSVRKVAERTLVELGVDVTLAVDGVDALEKLRDGTFDLIFTDLEMPRMHGYELIREVRFMPRLKEIPMVVVSSRSGTRHQDQARSVGASDYLTKPFTTQMLKTAIEHLVPRWKAS